MGLKIKQYKGEYKMTIQYQYEAHFFMNKNNTWMSAIEKFV